jgi:methyl-accepting chemotaxis protein
VSFKNKIALVVSIIVFIGLSLFGVFSYMDTKDSSIKQVSSALDAKAKALNDYVDLWLKNKKDIVADTAVIFKYAEDSWEGELMPQLKKYATRVGAMDAYIGFADGRMVLGSGGKLPEGYDPRVRPWYKKAIATKTVGVTDAYKDATTGGMIVTIMAPIFDDDKKLVGVYGIDLGLDELTTVIQKSKVHGGYAVLYDQKRTIVAHPNKKSLGKVSVAAKQFDGLNSGYVDYVYKGKDKMLSFYRTKESGWITAVNFEKKLHMSF